ncbi:MAG TPA: hypothetical protein PLS60_06610 [Arenimonas sp.]|nr:hypothetical protein [Arenimonas sp.]HPO23969.1 hypothetical protein [Arenimonas sp.]
MINVKSLVPFFSLLVVAALGCAPVAATKKIPIDKDVSQSCNDAACNFVISTQDNTWLCSKMTIEKNQDGSFPELWMSEVSFEIGSKFGQKNCQNVKYFQVEHAELVRVFHAMNAFNTAITNNGELLNDGELKLVVTKCVSDKKHLYVENAFLVEEDENDYVSIFIEGCGMKIDARVYQKNIYQPGSIVLTRAAPLAPL